MRTARLLPSLTLLLAAVLALSSCGEQGPGGATGTPDDGSGEPTSTIEHPTGEGDVVVSIRTAGGFRPWQVAVGTQPTVLVTGDGRVFGPGMSAAIYPGPLVAPVSTGRLDEAEVQDLLELARVAGLLDQPVPDYGTDRMATDLPTTEVVINADGSTVRHRAYGLGSQAAESGDARRALAGFVADAQQAVVGSMNDIYRPTALLVRSMPADGRQAPRPMPRDDDVPPREWPGSAGFRLAEECGVVDDPTTVRMLLQARQDELFTDGGKTWQVAARALLPGDPGCSDAA